MPSLRKAVVSFLAAAFLACTIPAPVMANERGTESGDDVAIVFDVLVLRPVGLAMTIGGTALFVVAFPFALTSWTIPKAYNALIKEPFKYTFVRDLGEARAD
jgi:hypothetical protein